jgi:hypothetical protein
MKMISVTAIIVGLFAGSAAWAAPTDEQKCEAAKLKAYAKHYFCRQKAEAKAVLAGEAADFAACDAKLTTALGRIEAKFPGTDPAFGCSIDSIHVRSELTNVTRRDAGDMACRLTKEKGVVRIERAGSILFVEFDAALNPTFSLRNVSNIPLVHARCFYAPSQGPCNGSAEFDIDLGAQSDVTWSAATGAGTIPAVPAALTQGFLVCVQIDDAEAPFLGNTLIASVTDDERCAQDGLPIRGLTNPPTAIFTDDLCLGASTSTDCPNGAEYEPCPYLLDGALKPQIEACWSTISSFDFHCQ